MEVFGRLSKLFVLVQDSAMNCVNILFTLHDIDFAISETSYAVWYFSTEYGNIDKQFS